MLTELTKNNMKKLNQLLIACVTSLSLLTGCGSGFDSGEGKKIGQIVKIGSHGFFCSTYEAELIRGGFNGGSGVNGNALDFTIKSKKLYEQLTKAMENQQEVELHYSKRAFSGPCYSETNVVATGFKVLEKKEVEEKKVEKAEVKAEKIEEVDTVEDI